MGGVLSKVAQSVPPSKWKASTREASYRSGAPAGALGGAPDILKNIMTDLGKSLRGSTKMTSVQKAVVFQTYDLDEELEQLEMEMQDELLAGVALAESEAGDSQKYKTIVDQMTTRWKLFLVMQPEEKQLTEATLLELMPKYASYMFHFRQRRSRVGRQGLGDEVSQASQKVLVQVSAGRPRTPCDRKRDAAGE